MVSTMTNPDIADVLRPLGALSLTEALQPLGALASLRLKRIAVAATILGETSATALAGLKVGETLTRLRGVLGKRAAEVFEAEWAGLDRDAPLVTARDGNVASRTTLWRMFRDVGHVVMRRLTAKVKAVLVKAVPVVAAAKPVPVVSTPKVTWPNDPEKEAELAYWRRRLPESRLRMMGLIPD